MITLIATSGAETVREVIPHNVAGTLNDLYELVVTSARQRTGRKVSVSLSMDGTVLPASERPVATLGAEAAIECRIFSRVKLLMCEPLCGPENKSTLVHIHGEGLDGIGSSARIQFGSALVSVERVSESLLRCHSPALPAGLVRVSLLRCENESAASDDAIDEDEDTASFKFVRLEAAYDAIFATTNSFCPIRGHRSGNSAERAECDRGDS